MYLKTSFINVSLHDWYSDTHDWSTDLINEFMFVLSSLAKPCYLSCQEYQAVQVNLDVPAIRVILVHRENLWNPGDLLALLAQEVPALCGSVCNFSVDFVDY